MKKKIYYWSPCLAKVATITATMNSAISLAKYSESFEVKIINVCGEWTSYKKYLLDNKVELENLTFDYYNHLPKHGFIRSRISNFIIILISIFPLLLFLKNKKINYLVIHLITSLPLFLLNFINTNTKFILRISGFPKLNFFRKNLWRISEKKIFKITCPTNDLRNDLIKIKIFNKDKLVKLSDPVVNIREFIKKKRDKNFGSLSIKESSFFIAVGRLTRQKNFIYLIKEFKKFLKTYPNEKLLIFGEGELKNKILNKIKEDSLSNNVKLCGYTENIYKYMIRSNALILSSLWEDPGFVMIEAALCNSYIISSDCKNGPREFLLNGAAGSIFKSNCEDALFQKLIEFKNITKIDIFKKKILAKKNTNNFTMFRHYQVLKNILEV